MTDIETEWEDYSCWIAEIVALPGVLVHGATEAEAWSRAAALAVDVLADRKAHDHA